MSKPQLKQTLRGLPCPTSSLQRKKSLGPAFSTSRQESLCAYKQNTSEIANIWGRASKLFVQDFEKVHDFLGGDFKHVERGMISYQQPKNRLFTVRVIRIKRNGFEILHLCRRLLWQACETGRWADSLPCKVWCSQMTAQENLEWYTVDNIHFYSCSNLEASFWIG